MDQYDGDDMFGMGDAEPEGNMDMFEMEGDPFLIGVCFSFLSASRVSHPPPFARQDFQDMEGGMLREENMILQQDDQAGARSGRRGELHLVEDPDNAQTSRFMTKYERARILGTRALQIR